MSRQAGSLFFSILIFSLGAAAAQITAGPMLGHVTSRTANIWLQADGEASLQIEYWPVWRPQDRRMSEVARPVADADFTAQMTLTGLDPGTRYLYEIFIDGQQAPTPGSLDFVTQPLWRGRSAPADFTVYLGSCAYINDPSLERPDSAYGGDYQIFQAIAGQAANNPRPHMMLWLGDNVYLREADYESPWGMNARYRHARALPELQPLLRAMPHYAIWDDHDYGPNDANRSFVFKDESLALFRRYWANPSYGLDGLPGIFTTFSFLDVDFFLLDDRFYRASDKTAMPTQDIDLMKEAKDFAIGYNPLTRLIGKRFAGSTPVWLGENKVIFGAEQLNWLKQALIQSRATFKIIASGSQLLNDASTAEGWQNFSAEREAFLDWLRQQNIPGVIFLSGDRHHTELIRRELKSFYPLHELTCSPLTSTPRTPQGKESNHRQRIPGTLVTRRNFCTLDVIGPADNRRILMRSFDSDGTQLWEGTLNAADLVRKEAPVEE